MRKFVILMFLCMIFSAHAGTPPVKNADGGVPIMTAGTGNADNYRLYQGYRQNFSSDSTCCVVPGDANHSGMLGIQDLTYIIRFLYKGGPEPPCEGGPGRYPEADSNGDGVLNIKDATYIILFLYKSGPAPVCGPM
ncbi:MAG: hypothetical protein NTV06_09465 [candidate division Zixibacteria bacterium]|nr:hypothetical protein [candidate division Zixibacteria bacterium]